MLNTLIESYGHGDKQAADDAVNALLNGIEMLRDAAPRVPYQRPVRNQPTRRKNHRSRR